MKYESLLDIYVADADMTDADMTDADGYKIIKGAIGKTDNSSLLINLCKKRKVSSTLQPTGKFLDLYTRGILSNFKVEKTIKVQGRSVGAIFNNDAQGLDYVKIDTQGSEFSIIKGFSNVTPIVIEVEISFVPLYKNSSIFFDFGKYLYDKGYILFHQQYVSRGAYGKYKTTSGHNNKIPIHGDAFFMPDWTREKGLNIIKGRESKWEALMLMFGMGDILNYAKNNICTKS